MQENRARDFFGMTQIQNTIECAGIILRFSNGPSSARVESRFSLQTR
jgi:hypothetical protein